MSKHILEPGKDIISEIVSLGKALNYVVKEEFPVENSRKSSPVVDVAWLTEENHNFPLMIFEIESRVSNSAVNNPVKVFGQPNENFEKPLFFFHIFVKNSPNSTRISNMRRLFGTYNYRTYTKEKDRVRLIEDIISQHRRLYSSLNIANIIGFITSSSFSDNEITKILIHIENLKFQTDFLKQYSIASLHDKRFRNHYLRYLKRYVLSKSQREFVQLYNTYWRYVVWCG